MWVGVAVLGLGLLLGAPAPAGAPCAGEQLHNGICLPPTWPPRPRNYSDRIPTPPYLTPPIRPPVIDITTGRQLLVDAFLIERTNGTVEWHDAQPWPHNPILSPTLPWEESVAMPFSGGLWWHEGRYKLWYSCGRTSNTTCYAESTDGLRFTKPRLHDGTNRVEGSAPHDGNVVWLDHDEPDAARRWKIAEIRRCAPPSPRCDFRHYTLLASRDGRVWRPLVNRSGVTADRATIFQDRFRQRWVFSIKSDSAYGRSRAYWEGSDLYRDSHWLGIDSIPYGTPYGNASDTPVPW